MRPTRHNQLKRAASTIPVVGGAVALATTVGLTGLIGLAAAATPAGASQAPSAQTKYLASINAVGDQGVHFVSHAKQGNVTFTVTGDTGTKSGVQTLTLKQGSTVEHMTVLLVGSTGYINGNTTALTDVIGLDKTAAKKYAGQWVSFGAAKQQYSDLTAGLLDSQVAGELKMTGPYHFGKTKTIDGKSATAIVGKVTDNSGDAVGSTLYVAASGPPLPIEQTTGPRAKGPSPARVTFTKWGQHAEPESTGALHLGHQAAGRADLGHHVDHRLSPVARRPASMSRRKGLNRAAATRGNAGRHHPRAGRRHRQRRQRTAGGRGRRGRRHSSSGRGRTAACGLPGHRRLPARTSRAHRRLRTAARFIIHTVGPIWHGGT